MKLCINGFSLDMGFYLRFPGKIRKVIPVEKSRDIYEYDEGGTFFRFTLYEDNSYTLFLKSLNPASLKIEIQLLGEKDIRHIIPCNIYGDNNLSHSKPGYFPNLTYDYPKYDSSSPEWEFRADRASHPISLITCRKGTIGISISPYSINQDKSDGSFIRNGVFSSLPDKAGVSFGYLNYPFTFTSKESMTTSSAHYIVKSHTEGKIYAVAGKGLRTCADIIKDVYNKLRECPSPAHSIDEYLNGFLDSYMNINWSVQLNAFTNKACTLPDNPKLKSWRPLIAIGWTGTGVLAYPLLSAQICKGITNEFTEILYGCFDDMAERINPSTGLFYDLIRPWKGSDVNGWWAGYIVKDCHCAYTNGSGIYYMLKTYMLLEKTKNERHTNWLVSSLTALDAILALQKDNGNYGYTYSTDKPQILDQEGFSGCWFAAACTLAYKITGKNKYLDSAVRGMSFYFDYVSALDCWGAPMDTWKSIDQEGNLSFIRAARHLHEITRDSIYIEMMERSAEYEYMWRYSFKAKPEFKPLKNSPWNSCGGSVTSVSNPHIHPMGVSITGELLYLYKTTGNIYHLHRAEDGLFWGLATADLYPDTTGYGRLGVISERYCPSDGLVIEKYSDTGEPSSIWFAFNGWAGVSILEGLTETLVFNDPATNHFLVKDIKNIFKNILVEVKE